MIIPLLINEWNIILQYVVSTFFHFFFKVKDSWDVDSDAESEDSSNDKGVYVKKKPLFFSFAVKDCTV
mgnify:CR=1 FL=1